MLSANNSNTGPEFSLDLGDDLTKPLGVEKISFVDQHHVSAVKLILVEFFER